MTNKFPDNCDLLVTKIVLTKYFKELLSITFRRKKNGRINESEKREKN